MDLETVLSRSVLPLDRREAILCAALLQRRAGIRKSWRDFISAECLESLGPLAPEVESFLSGPNSCCDLRPVAGFTWLDCDTAFLDCLNAIALAKGLEYRTLETRPDSWSAADLKKLAGRDRFQALCARYCCPLNIGLGSELELAEELLRQLMVTDRTKLEAEAEFDVDEVLLKLNLVGIRALITRDLRCCDCLNYFYELPRRSLFRMRANSRLLASWLCIYSQLLCVPDWLRCVSP